MQGVKAAERTCDSSCGKQYETSYHAEEAALLCRVAGADSGLKDGPGGGRSGGPNRDV